MTRLFLPFLLILLFTSNLYSSQSTIIEVDGIACMGYDKSRKQTEGEALTNAEKKSRGACIHLHQERESVEGFRAIVKIIFLRIAIRNLK